MRTLTGLPGSMWHSNRLYENAKSDFECFLMHLTEKIDGFHRLAV